MDKINEPLQALENKYMIGWGSRFVSLSGWNGIAAGICALVAAWLAGKNLMNCAISENEYEAI